MIGADQVAEFLATHQIKVAFGIIGSGNAAIFDAISRLGKTRIVCSHHEQAATMASIAYNRVAENAPMSVVLVTTGAGSTNAITGVVSAWADSIPLLILSGNEKTSTHGNLRMWGVQGYDSCLMVKAVTKKATRVLFPKDLQEGLRYAIDLSQSDRPGPVWVDIPMDVQLQNV